MPDVMDIINLIKTGGEALKTVRDNLPLLEDEVTVEVVGQPGSNKQQLYYLALAAANGMVTRMGASLLSISGSYGMLMIEYDGASDWVRCTIRYKFGMAQLAVGGASLLTVGADRFAVQKLAVYRGPSCDVVGGKFDFTGQGTTSGLPGIPNSSKAIDGAPQLPFAGQMILTACPTTPQPVPTAVRESPVPTAPLGTTGAPVESPNPKPPGDNRSRGAIYIPGTSQGATPGNCCDKLLALIPMVTAALSDPATNSQMTYEVPSAGPIGR